MGRIISSGLRRELWTSPRTSIKYIFNINSKQNTVLFPFLYTILWLSPALYTKKFAFLQHLTHTHLFFISVLGGFLGIMASQGLAFLFHTSSQLLGKPTTFNKMLSAVSWFLYTTTPALFLYYATQFWDPQHNFLNFILLAMLTASCLYSLSLLAIFLSVASKQGLFQTIFLPTCVALLAMVFTPHTRMNAFLFNQELRGYDFYLSEFQTRYLLDKLSVSLVRDNPDLLNSDHRLPIPLVRHGNLAAGAESFRIAPADYKAIAPNLDLYFLNKNPRWAFVLYAYTNDRKLLASWRMNRKKEFCRVYVSKRLNVKSTQNKRCQKFQSYSNAEALTRPKLSQHD